MKLLEGKKGIGCKYVFREKKSLKNKEVKFKARLVAKRFAQREGIDSDETLSPVVKLTSICSLLSMVAMQDLELEHLDVTTTFLRGEPEEEICM